MSKSPASPKSNPAADNRSTQLNRQHDAFWQSRGLPERPASAGTSTATPTTTPTSQPKP